MCVCSCVHVKQPWLDKSCLLYWYRFLLGCILYFVIGCAVKHFVKGAQGIEIIPNINFWVDLPNLLKVSGLTQCCILCSIGKRFQGWVWPNLVQDGCLLVVSPCYKAGTGYDELWITSLRLGLHILETSMEMLEFLYWQLYSCCNDLN